MHNYNKYDQGGYEEAVMMGDPPAKEYNTYMMQEGQPQNGPGQYAQVSTQETDLIAQSQADWGDGGGEQQAPASANPFHAPPESNPFRR